MCPKDTDSERKPARWQKKDERMKGVKGERKPKGRKDQLAKTLFHPCKGAETRDFSSTSSRLIALNLLPTNETDGPSSVARGTDFIFACPFRGKKETC